MLIATGKSQMLLRIRVREYIYIFYIYIHVHIHVHIYLHIFSVFILCLSVYFEHYTFTLIPPNPILYHRIHFSVLPFIDTDHLFANINLFPTAFNILI